MQTPKGQAHWDKILTYGIWSNFVQKNQLSSFDTSSCPVFARKTDTFCKKPQLTASTWNHCMSSAICITLQGRATAAHQAKCSQVQYCSGEGKGDWKRGNFRHCCRALARSQTGNQAELSWKTSPFCPPSSTDNLDLKSSTSLSVKSWTHFWYCSQTLFISIKSSLAFQNCCDCVYKASS